MKIKKREKTAILSKFTHSYKETKMSIKWKVILSTLLLAFFANSTLADELVMF